MMRTSNYPSLKNENLLPKLSNRSPLNGLDDIFLTSWSEAASTWPGMHRLLRNKSLAHYEVSITKYQDTGRKQEQRLAFYERSASRASKPLRAGTDKTWNYKFCWHYVLGYVWTNSLLHLSCIKVIRVERISLFIAFLVFPTQWENTGPAWERDIANRQASKVGLTNSPSDRVPT